MRLSSTYLSWIASSLPNTNMQLFVTRKDNRETMKTFKSIHHGGEKLCIWYDA